MEIHESKTRGDIDPKLILPNLDNPRKIFEEKPIKELEVSIKESGILVPLIVYYDKTKKKYVLLDGERRLRCAQKLNKKLVPVNVIDEPDRLHNILLMFNIHNVRESWEMVPTALKLKTIMKLHPKNTSIAKLSELTGMTKMRTSECIRILEFDQKYLNMTLEIDYNKRIKGDFFSQLAIPLKKLKKYQEVTNKYDNNKIIDLMIEKYKEGTIINATNEFRTLKKVLGSYNKGVEKKLISRLFEKFLQSKPKKNKDGVIIRKAMSIDDLFELTLSGIYLEDQIVKKSDQLIKLICALNEKKSKNTDELIKSLSILKDHIQKNLLR